jgi:hypothetical protein
MKSELQTIKLSEAQKKLAAYCQAVRNLVNFTPAEREARLAEARRILEINI